jgi:coproporphyrinogen III oxidase-like Fe-S oxidoreductase
MIRMFLKENLVFLDQDRIRLTEKGFLLCDEITERLLTVV